MNMSDYLIIFNFIICIYIRVNIIYLIYYTIINNKKIVSEILYIILINSFNIIGLCYFINIFDKIIKVLIIEYNIDVQNLIQNFMWINIILSNVFISIIIISQIIWGLYYIYKYIKI